MIDDLFGAIDTVAEALGERLPDFVFVGGTAGALLIQDTGAERIRGTDDVDVVVAITSYHDYAELQETLRTKHGFKHDPDGPNCRFVVHGIKVDVLPIEEKILGFKNKWYGRVAAQPETFVLNSGKAIKLISAPLFLCTKIEAFLDRGGDDYLGSKDMEDIIAQAEGRPSLLGECQIADPDVRAYIAEGMSRFLKEPRFEDALQGHLFRAPEGRLKILRDRCKALASLK